MKVFAIGATRNIGYGATLRLLKGGHNVTFLARNPAVFDEDINMKTFVSSKQAKIVKGDALNAEDIKNAWNEAESDGASVDLVLFSVGK
jgi:NAD(P)-dependent dehydrogenase (short-subunit alcohol dehydrogenase family)